jgi:hypothetical protein
LTEGLLNRKILVRSIQRKVNGGLEPKSIRGNRLYKGHREIVEKASHHFKKASILLKIYLKKLASFNLFKKGLKNN